MTSRQVLRGLANALLCAAVAVPLIGCASSHANAPGSGVDRGKCGDFELDVDRFWSSETKGEVRAGILKVGGDWTEKTSERVVTKMDNLTRDWVMMQEGICKDTVEREVMPKEAYVKVSLCLRSSLVAQRTLVETLKAATKEHLFSVDNALDKVQQDCAACQQEAIYSAYDDAPDDTAAQQAREKIAEATVYRELGDNRGQAASLAAGEAAKGSQTIRVKVDALNEQAGQASYHANWEAIAPFAQQALQLAESDGYEMGIARAKDWLATSYSIHMDYTRAMQLTTEALAIYRRVAGEESREVANVYEGMAIDYSNQEDYARGLQMYRRSLAIKRKVWGEHSFAVATIYSRMGITYRLKGDYPSALEMAKKALATYRMQTDPPAPDNVASEMDDIRWICKKGYQPACSPP